MKRQEYMWAFRYVFWIIAFYNFLESTDLLQGKFDLDYLYYYTNLSNFLVFIWITFVIIQKFFNLKSSNFQTTIKFSFTVIIMITFLIYNTILGDVLSVSYWRLSNVLKHFLIPLLMFVDYIFFTPKSSVEKNDTYKSLLFPLAYFVYAMVRGIFTHDYPYFFIDPISIGYFGVLIYVIVITAFIWLFSYILYKQNRKGNKV